MAPKSLRPVGSQIEPQPFPSLDAALRHPLQAAPNSTHFMDDILRTFI
jgi:hypothetical protein